MMRAKQVAAVCLGFLTIVFPLHRGAGISQISDLVGIALDQGNSKLIAFVENAGKGLARTRSPPVRMIFQYPRPFDKPLL